MTPHSDEHRYESGAAGGTAGWVKWIVGLMLPVIVAMASVMITDHVELAVMRSKQDDVIATMVKQNERITNVLENRIVGLLEKVIEQHRDMSARQDRFDDRMDVKGRDTPVFSNGRRFENK